MYRAAPQGTEPSREVLTLRVMRHCQHTHAIEFVFPGVVALREDHDFDAQLAQSVRRHLN